LQRILVLNGDITYLFSQIAQDQIIKGLFKCSCIFIGLKVHSDPCFELCRVSVNNSIEPRCNVVLSANGKKFLKDLEIVDNMTLEEILGGLFELC
jgi:hypothetical protein